MMLRLLAAASCSLLCTLTISLAVDAEGVNEDRSRIHSLKPYGRTSDTAPAETREAAEKGFRRAKFPPGFQGTLWASEPLLANPVAFSFDAKGRMYIAETHRYRTSVLDIRHYMFMLEDDLANRNQADWEKSIKKNFPNDWQNLGIESEVVRLVEDSDGDGKADKSSVYADGFNSILDGIASGVLARPDGVWLTNIPGLYKLTGSSPDGKAAKKEEIFRGFGVRFNYTGHDLHGLIKGPDGRLYFSIGDRGTSVKTKEGGTIDVPDEGAIFRCEEDGSHLELVMRGLRNPQELAFDDYGNLFTCDNDSDQGDRERFVYVLEGGDAGWRVGYQHCPQPAERNPWLAEHMWEPRDPAKNQPAYILSPLANLPDGPGGFVHYPGTGLPDKYKGCFFLACYKGSSLTSQVAVLKPVPNGASFKLELLETFIPGCQATDVDFGPDSRLYVSFWDEGWERTAQGRIMKVEHEEARKAQAAQIAEVQKLLSEGMKDRSCEELVALFAHNDQRVRLEAQWELAGRDPAQWRSNALGAFQHMRERQQLHTVWALGQAARKSNALSFGKGLPEDAIAVLSVLPEPVAAAVLAFAAEVNPEQLDASSQIMTVKVLSHFLAGKSAVLARNAAMAMGRHGKAENIPLLLSLARREQNKSQEMRHVIAHALVQLAQRNQEAWKTIRDAAKDSDAAVRIVIMIASAQLAEKAATMKNGEPWFQDASALLSGFLQDADPSLSRNAAWLITDKGLRKAGDALAKGPVTAADTMTTLRRINAMSGIPLAAFASDEKNDPALRAEAWRFIQSETFPNTVTRDRVVGVFRPRALHLPPGVTDTAWQMKRVILKYAPPNLHASKEIALDALKALRLALLLRDAGGNKTPVKYHEEIAALSVDEKADPAVRVAALRVLADVESKTLSGALTKTVKSPNSTVRITSAGLLGKSDPAAAAKGLDTALAQGTPEDTRAAFTELAPLTGAEADRILAEQLILLTAGKVPAVARLELLEAASKHTAPVVQEALRKYEASLPNSDLLAKFSTCLEGGDAASGKRLFKEHAVAACQRCHMVDKAGGEAGPPLDGIASRKDRRYMLESILLPNAQIAETFRMIVCTMKDGSVKSGVLKSETADIVTIQSPGEEPLMLKSADVARKDSIPSAMLPNMGDLLTKREIRDIVEYLATLK